MNLRVVGVDAAGGDLLSNAGKTIVPLDIGDGVVLTVDVVVVDDLLLVRGRSSA